MTGERAQPCTCTLCDGRGYVTRWHRKAGKPVHRVDNCGRCYGSGIEPTQSLRELRDLNQQRLKGNT